MAELAGYENGEYDIRYLYITDRDGQLEKTENGLLDRERLIRARLSDKVKGRAA